MDIRGGTISPCKFGYGEFVLLAKSFFIRSCLVLKSVPQERNRFGCVRFRQWLSTRCYLHRVFSYCIDTFKGLLNKISLVVSNLFILARHRTAHQLGKSFTATEKFSTCTKSRKGMNHKYGNNYAWSSECVYKVRRILPPCTETAR